MIGNQAGSFRPSDVIVHDLLLCAGYENPPSRHEEEGNQVQSQIWFTNGTDALSTCSTVIDLSHTKRCATLLDYQNGLLLKHRQPEVSDPT